MSTGCLCCWFWVFNGPWFVALGRCDAGRTYYDYLLPSTGHSINDRIPAARFSPRYIPMNDTVRHVIRQLSALPSVLDAWYAHTRYPKRGLLSSIGILSLAAVVVPPGRCWLAWLFCRPVFFGTVVPGQLEPCYPPSGSQL